MNSNNYSEQPCKCSSCSATGYQYADISIPIEICPDISIGQIETECCGAPTIVCCEYNCCYCEVILNQKICIKIPVKYNVTAIAGESCICCDCNPPPYPPYCDKQQKAPKE